MYLVVLQSVSTREVKTEADGNDVAPCSHDDKPTIGVFECLVIFGCLRSPVVSAFLPLSIVLSAFNISSYLYPMHFCHSAVLSIRLSVSVLFMLVLQFPICVCLLYPQQCHVEQISWLGGRL